MTSQPHLPTFNPLEYPACLDMPRHVKAVAWQEHIPFAMALVQMLRPKVLVELGVHTGDSYLAFCQAVSTLNCDTACYGVDTWKGDAHAGFYGSEILTDLRTWHDSLYGKFSRLVQSTFDEAASYFPDGAVNLLHIDGYHTYDAVKHDWEVWRPKLAGNAVVLFHDVNVRERDFGVWKFWAELSAERPHFTFKHGHGLGVLGAGAEVPLPLQQLFSLDVGTSAASEAFFFALGNRITLHAQTRQLASQMNELQRGIGERLREGAERAQTFEREIAARAQTFEREIAARTQTFEREIAARDGKIQKLECEIAARDVEIQKLRRAIAEHGADNDERAARLTSRNNELQTALDAMASSSAVRAARLLRSMSPWLQSVAGSVGRALMPRSGR